MGEGEVTMEAEDGMMCFEDGGMAINKECRQPQELERGRVSLPQSLHKEGSPAKAISETGVAELKPKGTALQRDSQGEITPGSGNSVRKGPEAAKSSVGPDTARRPE